MKSLLPIAKKIADKSIDEDLIGLRPDETWNQAVQRHLLEKRYKKINKIIHNIKNKYI